MAGFQWALLSCSLYFCGSELVSSLLTSSFFCFFMSVRCFSPYTPNCISSRFRIPRTICPFRYQNHAGDTKRNLSFHFLSSLPLTTAHSLFLISISVVCAWPMASRTIGRYLPPALASRRVIAFGVFCFGLHGKLDELVTHSCNVSNRGLKSGAEIARRGTGCKEPLDSGC